MVVAPDSDTRLRRYLQDHPVPCQAVADPEGALLKALGQETVWWKMGRMPGFLAINQTGRIVYAHAGQSMRDFPDWAEAERRVLEQ